VLINALVLFVYKKVGIQQLLGYNLFIAYSACWMPIRLCTCLWLC